VTKPIVSRDVAASETDRLRQAVNAYHAQKGALPSATAQQPERRRQPPAERPTEIPGFPLNDSPPAEIPDYGTMSRVQAIKHRQRKIGAQLPITGEPQLIKRRDLRTGRVAE
jgi:hypothetical protein